MRKTDAMDGPAAAAAIAAAAQIALGWRLVQPLADQSARERGARNEAQLVHELAAVILEGSGTMKLPPTGQ